MAFRDVTIRIKADVSGFTAGISKAVASTKAFEHELEKSSAKRQALNDIGSSFGKIGLAAGIAAGASVRAFANFDQGMSKVKAALSTKELDRLGDLRAAALKAGKDTQFSATEAAAGVESLVKAGVSAKDVLGGGLSAALNIAASDSIDVATAADIAATSMNQFGLTGTKNVEHVADVLTGTSNAAQGSVLDMAEAFKYVGPVAKTMGMSIDDTAAAVGILAKQGTLGSEAGTALRAVLLSLTGSGRSAAKTLKSIGLDSTDFANKKGEFIGLAAASEKLRDALAGKTDFEKTGILAKLFGKDRATAAQNFLDAGAKGFAAMNKQIRDQASAAEIAAIKMDNLKGDWEQLRGSFETALIGAGSGANGPLRTTLQDARKLVDAFNDLPQPMQSATTGMLALTAVLGGSVFLGTRLLTGIANTRTQMTTLGANFDKTRARAMAFKGGVAVAGLALGSFIQQSDDTNRSLGVLGGAVGGAAAGAMFGPWGAALGGAAGAVQGFTSANSAAKDEVHALAQTLDDQTYSITENTKAFVTNALEKSGTLAAARRQGVSLPDLRDASTGDPEAQARVNAQLAAASRRAVKNNKGAYSAGLFDFTKDGRDLNKIAGQMEKFAKETSDAQAALERTNEALRHLSSAEIDKVVASVKGVPRDVVTQFTQRGAPDAIDTAVKVAHAAHLTPAKVESVLSVLDYSTKQIEAVQKALKDLDKSEANPTVNADTNAAKSKLQEVLNLITTISTLGVVVPSATSRATGGAISGPGSGTSDSIPARLSNGEHVLTASDVRKAGGQGAIYRMRAGIQSGALRFASGGAVDGMTSAERRLAIARLQAELAGYDAELKTTKGKWPREVLKLEHKEDLAALRRLKAGYGDSADLGLDALRDARNEPVSLFDGASDSPWMNRGGFASRAQQKLAQIKALAAKLIQLRKAGLNGALLAEIYGLGTAQGIAAADELLKSPGEIKQLNAAHSGIQAANGLVAAAAYEAPASSGGVHISIRDVSFDAKTLKASMEVIARDAAGNVLARDKFESKVH